MFYKKCLEYKHSGNENYVGFFCHEFSALLDLLHKSFARILVTVNRK
ncbi:hypothetical protein LDFHOB_08565 [Candidatus Electronema aureum]